MSSRANTRRLGAQGGYALPELLVALVVAAIVFGATLTVFTGFLDQNVRADRNTDAQDRARTTVDNIATQLRNAMAAGTASQPVEKHSSFDLVYLAPVISGATLTDNPRGVQHVRFCMDASVARAERIWMQTAPYNAKSAADPPATLSCPDVAWPTRTIAAADVVNLLRSPPTPLFTVKTDASGNVTDVALHAVVDVDPANAPPAVELQSKVSLRNLNRPPTAQLNCQALANGHVVCDGSASTDPDGHALGYAWEMNGTKLAETTSRLDQPNVASKARNTFTLTVTDSGGVSVSASQSVTMP